MFMRSSPWPCPVMFMPCTCAPANSCAWCMPLPFPCPDHAIYPCPFHFMFMLFSPYVAMLYSSRYPLPQPTHVVLPPSLSVMFQDPLPLPCHTILPTGVAPSNLVTPCRTPESISSKCCYCNCWKDARSGTRNDQQARFQMQEMNFSEQQFLFHISLRLNVCVWQVNPSKVCSRHTYWKEYIFFATLVNGLKCEFGSECSLFNGASLHLAY